MAPESVLHSTSFFLWGSLYDSTSSHPHHVSISLFFLPFIFLQNSIAHSFTFLSSPFISYHTCGPHDLAFSPLVTHVLSRTPPTSSHRLSSVHHSHFSLKNTFSFAPRTPALDHRPPLALVQPQEPCSYSGCSWREATGPQATQTNATSASSAEPWLRTATGGRKGSQW